jgi:hypothetical protein
LKLGNLHFSFGKKIPFLHWERGRISAPDLENREPCKCVLV